MGLHLLGKLMGIFCFVEVLEPAPQLGLSPVWPCSEELPPYALVERRHFEVPLPRALKGVWA